MKSKDLNSNDRSSGGWLSRRTNYMSWALSCLQFCKHYQQVELVTDKAGYELLIETLELPYTSIRVVLDDLNSFHPDLWALGKIFAYSLQEKPFVHADGDVYIWERLGFSSERAPLLAQNLERFDEYYKPVYNLLLKHFTFIPPELKAFESLNNSTAINAGVIGGSNIPFFKEYTKGAFEFVEKNIDKLKFIDIGKFNAIFEQSYFYALADQKKEPIECLFKSEINNSFDGMADFTGVPRKVKFIHTMGGYKKLKYIGDQLESRLQIDYPDYFYRIKKLLHNCQI